MPSDPGPAYKAQYNDGETARARSVVARADPSGLLIIRDDETVTGSWAWDDVRLAEPASGARPIRLANRAQPGARLTIEDAAALSVLRMHARYLTREPLDRRKVIQIGSVAAAGIGVILFFVYGLPWVAKPMASLVPVAWEEPVGDSTVQIVNKLFADGRPVCDNAAGKAALDRLSAKLLATFDTPYRIRVDVADAAVVNAFAAPGGRIVLFRGLIERARAPAEVAGVLAHEMTHVYRRHPTQALINAVGWSSLLSVFTGGASVSSEATARLAAHLAASANTRTLEAEADDGAIAMLSASGIGTDGMMGFFRSVRHTGAKGFDIPAYLSSHPQIESRIEAIERKASKPSTHALSDADWKALRNICSKK